MIGKIKRRIKRLVRTEPIPAPRDEFLAWLEYAVAGMTHPGNYPAFDRAIREMPSGAVVEIGSWCGRSANAITHLLDKHRRDNPMFTCDKWEPEREEQAPMIGESLKFSDLKAFLKESYIRNTQIFTRPERLPHTVQMDSDEFFAEWEKMTETTDVFGRRCTLGGPIAFCFIDGNHTYDFAKRDFEGTDRFLVPGGFVLFDDSGDGTPWEVCRVVADVKASGRYEVVSHEPNYLFRKR